MASLARLSLNLATTRLRWGAIEAIEGAARAGLRAVAPWRDLVAKDGLEATAKAIRDNGLGVSSLCRGGMFAAADAAGRQAAIDDNRRAVDEATALGARSLVLVVGGLAQGSKDIAGARAMVADGLAAVLPHARAAAIPLAIEPLHPMYAADRACINTLAQALDLCDSLGEGVGVVVDVYHLWWDPDLEARIERAGKRRLLGFHVSDWLVPTTDLLLDRGMIGDGVIDIPRIRGWMEAAGYDGAIEIEIFSAENWWKRDPDEVVAICKERFETAV
ncbi:MAG: sugar phosphate isomerase/epimerase family protein [Alphaproteobacteria bacterium]|jgi:sugar phosphate isomerase/epimerase|nr:sugar phosphate isomerase/epimerase family protein [Alphaproteobacteria bacterium]